MAKKPAKAEKIKKEKKEPWVAFCHDDYRDAVKDLVHFSAKAVNSNSTAGGVRLDDSCLVNLPYVSIRTYGPSKVLLDYQVMDTKKSQVIKQMTAVMKGTAQSRFENVTQQDEDMITGIYRSVAMAEMIGVPDCRLKQVIMPDEDGNDTRLTPLHSAGLSDALLAAIDSEANSRMGAVQGDDAKKRISRAIRYAKMPFGGGNPQNVGGLIRSMQRPLIFKLPQEDFEMKRVFSIFHKGVDYVSKRYIEEYLDWRDSQKKVDDEYRSVEQDMIQRIVAVALKRGKQAFEVLTDNREQIGKELLSNEVNLVKRGLIISAERNAEWRNAFAMELGNAIANYKRQRTVNGRTMNVDSAIGSDEKMRLVSMISKGVLA